MARLTHEVIEFRPGPLRAEALNQAFRAIQRMVEEAARLALTPDPVVRQCEVRLARMEDRITALEGLTCMHERQRNEREWAPLSHLGAVLTRLNGLQDHVDASIEHLGHAHADITALHQDVNRRLDVLRQRPEPALQEDFDKLAASHAELKSKEAMLLAQTIALRAEVATLRELALGHDRLANRIEYAPLAYVAAILSRLQALEEAK